MEQSPKSFISSLAVFKIYSLSLVFCRFIVFCLGILFIPLGINLASQIIKLWLLLNIGHSQPLFLQIFFSASLLSSTSGTPVECILDLFILFAGHEVLKSFSSPFLSLDDFYWSTSKFMNSFFCCFPSSINLIQWIFPDTVTFQFQNVDLNVFVVSLFLLSVPVASFILRTFSYM